MQADSTRQIVPRRPGRPKGSGKSTLPKRLGRKPKRGRPGRPPKQQTALTLEQQAQRQRSRLTEVALTKLESNTTSLTLSTDSRRFTSLANWFTAILRLIIAVWMLMNVLQSQLLRINGQGPKILRIEILSADNIRSLSTVFTAVRR